MTVARRRVKQSSQRDTLASSTASRIQIYPVYATLEHMAFEQIYVCQPIRIDVDVLLVHLLLDGLPHPL